MHQWPLQQQRQVTLATQQRLDPVGDAHGSLLANLALPQPLARAPHQPNQPGAGLFFQRQHAGVVTPQRHPVPERWRKLLEQLIHVSCRGGAGFAAVAVFALLLTATQQGVKFLRDQFAPGIQLGQEWLG